MSEDGSKFDLAAVVAALKGKNGGDSDAALGKLVEENYELRNRNREYKERIDKSGVPEDSTIVKKADVEELEKYRATGKVDDIIKLKTDHAGLELEHSTLKKDQVTTNAAATHGFRAAVLKDIVAARSLSIEMGTMEVEKDGKKISVETAFVVSADKKTPLDSYIKENLPDYLPSLVVQSPQEQGVHWAHQSGPGSPAGGGAPQSAGAMAVKNLYGDKDKK